MMYRLLAPALLALAACGAARPPPRPSEEPIDTEAARRVSARNDNASEGPALPPPTLPPQQASSAAGPEASSRGTDQSGRSSSATGSSDKPAGKGKPGNKAGDPGKGQLSKPECDQMVDKYVGLVVTGSNGPLKGSAGKELENARAMIKTMVSQDPNFQGLQRSCLRDSTRTQYDCAMQARTAEEWQGCVK